MSADEDGQAIVDGVRGARPWWLLHADETVTMTRRLSGDPERSSSGDSTTVGLEWDGRSDLIAGAGMLPGAAFARLLARLANALSGKPLEPPIGRHVRERSNGPAADHGIVVDLKFEHFVLPVIVLTDGQSTEDDGRLGNMMERIVARVDFALANSDRVAAREERLRGAFKRAVHRIGRGAAPFWFRMEPIRADDSIESALGRCYGWGVLTLDHRLEWAEENGRWLFTARDADLVSSSLTSVHRGRVRTLDEVRLKGVPGLMDEVAAAVIEARCLTAADTFDEARRLADTDGSGLIVLEEPGCRIHLQHHDGRLLATLVFEKGVYCNGRLMLRGAFPETIASPRRPAAFRLRRPSRARRRPEPGPLREARGRGARPRPQGEVATRPDSSRASGERRSEAGYLIATTITKARASAV